MAQYAIEKAMALGAKVVTCSDSAGYVYLPEGFDREKLEALLELKNVKRGRVEEFAKQFGLQYFAGKTSLGSESRYCTSLRNPK